MILFAFAEELRLKREIHALQYEKMKLHTTLTHYQTYAGRLGSSSGMIGIETLAGLSPDLMGRATIFAQFANQASSMSAMQNLQQANAFGMFNNNIAMLTNPQVRMQIQMSAFAKFKEEAMKAIKQKEVERMNEVEKEIELRLATISTQIEEKQAMLKNAQETKKQGIQDFFGS